MKLLNDFAIALVQPKRYKELLSNSIGRVALYIIILMMLSAFSIVTTYAKIYNIFGTYYTENVPSFSFADNTLKSDDALNIELAGIKIAIDTGKQLTNDNWGQANNGIMFDSDSMLIKSGHRTAEIHYADLTDGKNISFTKDSLVMYAPIIKRLFIISSIFALILSFGLFMLGALVVAGLVWISNSMGTLKYAGLKFGEVYKLGLYSRALPTVLSLVLSMFIGRIPVLISIIISIMMLNSAITRMKIENMKNMKGFGEEKWN